MSRNGKTQTEVLSKSVSENFWIGPSEVCVIGVLYLSTFSEIQFCLSLHIYEQHTYKCL